MKDRDFHGESRFLAGMMKKGDETDEWRGKKTDLSRDLERRGDGQFDRRCPLWFVAPLLLLLLWPFFWQPYFSLSLQKEPACAFSDTFPHQQHFSETLAIG